MAAHSLSIAKASFLAACLRPDCTKVTRDDLTTFHTLLETCISRCTPTNIQNAKAWLLQHVLPSPIRTRALGKYLTSLSKGITNLPEGTGQTRPTRQRLHVLYLINDVFHHVIYHTSDVQLQQNARECLESSLPPLFADCAAEKKPRIAKRLQELIQIWGVEKYLVGSILTTLRNALSTDNPTDQKVEQQVDTRTTKELPWVMPSTHGDVNAPFFDLPAANLMPYIMPNSSKPMRPDQIRALHLTAGPADEGLVNAMKDFLRDVKAIDDPYAALEDDGIVPDIDAMGQISYKNEADDVVGDTYYGWSRAFCEKMKKRSKGVGGDDDRARSRSAGSSRSSSRSPRKRRRYSSSMSRSPSGSRSAYREPASVRLGLGSDLTNPHRGPAPAPLPYQPDPPRFQGRQPSFNQVPPPFMPQQSPPAPIVSPFQQPPLMHNGPAGSPPPRPPNWYGPWPPPPPPPPLAGPAGFTGSFPPHAPFPPPPPHNFNQQGYGKR